MGYDINSIAGQRQLEAHLTSLFNEEMLTVQIENVTCNASNSCVVIYTVQDQGYTYVNATIIEALIREQTNDLGPIQSVTMNGSN